VRFGLPLRVRYELVVEGFEGTVIASTLSRSCPAPWVSSARRTWVATRSHLARAPQVKELSPNALARADAMFASDPSPWFGFVF
jgi:hypothetical protein